MLQNAQIFLENNQKMSEKYSENWLKYGSELLWTISVDRLLKKAPKFHT